MIIFLGSWAMMFAALFFAYAVVRLRAPMWPPPDQPALPILVPGLNTVVIAASSLAVVLASRAHALGPHRRASIGLGVAAGLGALFLGLQSLVWVGGRRRKGVPHGGVQGADEGGRKNALRLGAHGGSDRLRPPLRGLPRRQGRRKGPRRGRGPASAARLHARVFQIRRRPWRHTAER